MVCLQCYLFSAVIVLLLSIDVYKFAFAADGLHGDEPRPPNIILFVGDDVGWGDLSVYGHPTQEPGPIDRMAAEGIRFTQWYAAASFCTPSRAALLTGRQPFRTGIYGPLDVLLPSHSGGLPHDEVTIAEALRDFAGYATGIVGKWHLGPSSAILELLHRHRHRPPPLHRHFSIIVAGPSLHSGVNEAVSDDGCFLPHTHGFTYVGTLLPFTLHWNCDTSKRHRKQPSTDWCILYRNSTIVEQPIVLESLTSRLVFDAKAFIHESRDKPFFLVVSFPQTHTPMFNHPDFRGKSKRGIYGDQINEMSSAVGEILDVVRQLHLERQTLALFISDHGPHLEICQEGGSAQPFREGKGYYGEGGLRIPAIAWWPGTINPGQVSTDVVSLLDVFPTVLDLAGIPPTAVNRSLDGHSAAASLLGKASVKLDDPQQFNILWFYCERVLVAARVYAFKIYFRLSNFPDEKRLRQSCTSGGFPVKSRMVGGCPTLELDPWLVYNVEVDPGEQWPVSIRDLDARIVEMLERKLRMPLNDDDDDVREPLLVRKNLHRKLVPCCNPPYCICRDDRL